MLSYLHRFHAGCFADVHKHLLLTRVLVALGRKDKPFCVLDLHGGEGVYDLGSEESLKTAEALSGIHQYLALTNPAHELSLPYWEVLKAASHQKVGDVYPGSPFVARQMIRSQDRLVAIELHPQAHKALRRCFRDDDMVHIHKRDAIEALHALTPPPEKRGLAVIDPAYEVKSEYATIPAAVVKAFGKWRAGIYFIWYPLLPDGRHEVLLSTLESAGFPEIFVSEWVREQVDSDRGMYGSGVAVVNPPWMLDQEADQLFSWLQDAGFEGCHRQRMIQAQS